MTIIETNSANSLMKCDSIIKSSDPTSRLSKKLSKKVRWLLVKRFLAKSITGGKIFKVQTTNLKKERSADYIVGSLFNIEAPRETLLRR